MSQVEGRVSASTNYVRAFVHQYVAGRINEARHNIEDYAKRYSETMEAALDTHREGKTLHHCVQAICCLVQTAQALLLMPFQSQGGVCFWHTTCQ